MKNNIQLVLMIDVRKQVISNFMEKNHLDQSKKATKS